MTPVSQNPKPHTDHDPIRRRYLRATVGEDYLLTFTADNGPEGSWIHPVPGQPGPLGTNPGSTGGLRGRKRDLTEGGIREPGLLDWPAAIKGNIRTNHPAGTVDWKPTIAEILEVELPRDWPLDGESLVPLILGRRLTRSKPMGWVWGMVLGNRNRTAVCGDWEEERVTLSGAAGVKDEVWYGPDSTGLRDGQGAHPNQQAWMTGDGMKLLGCNNAGGTPVRYFLYNITADPQERRDLSGDLPLTASRMEADLKAWMRSVNQSMGSNASNCLPPHPWGPVGLGTS